jgi:V/A-type H+/Na+-transporting ATPase subunit D
LTQIRLTKTELRLQQQKLAQLQRYLPTLQLKKAMLQMEVYNARVEAQERSSQLREAHERVNYFSPLLTEKLSIDIAGGAKVSVVKKFYENIAGVEIPLLEGVVFADFGYTLFDNPPWVDGALLLLRKEAEAQVQVDIAREKVFALERELREVSIRVNLFEKVLIPRTQDNIKKIRVRLGDEQLASVAQAKVAKGKIEARKEERRHA